MKFNLQAKLSAWAAIALLCLAVTPVMIGCTKTTIAQDIVAWTPTIISTSTTVASVVASIDPGSGIIISAAVAGFDMLAKLVAAQAQNYLDNPSTSVLLTLQNQVLTFQQQINSSILQAAKITNMQSQQRVLAAIEGLSTAVTAVIALIATVKGNTLSTASLTAPVKIAQVISPQQIDVSTQMVAEHYGITTGAAEASVRASIYALRRIGL